MSHLWKRALFGGVGAAALSLAGGALAQESEDPPEEEEMGEAAGAGAAVSEFAQGLGELDPDEVEGPGLSLEAKKLRGIAMENLPEEALENMDERALTAGRPEGIERPSLAERPDRPDRPERPQTVERPDRPDRPGRPF